MLNTHMLLGILVIIFLGIIFYTCLGCKEGFATSGETNAISDITIAIDEVTGATQSNPPPPPLWEDQHGQGGHYKELKSYNPSLTKSDPVTQDACYKLCEDNATDDMRNCSYQFNGCYIGKTKGEVLDWATGSQFIKSTEIPDGKPTPTFSTDDALTKTTSSDIGNIQSGTNTYDNYNHYNKTSSPTTYFGPDGGNARVVNVDGTYAIIVTDGNGHVAIYTIKSSGNEPVPTPPQNHPTNTIIVIDDKILNLEFECNQTESAAQIFKGPQGNYVVIVTLPSGEKKIFTETNTQSHSGNVEHSGIPLQPYPTTTNDYSSVLPAGIRKSVIPTGEEDKYILKSQVIPPVCPACPSFTRCPSNKEKCAPCSESTPDQNQSQYSSEPSTINGYDGSVPSGSNYEPIPVLNDFSTFGM